MGRKRKLALAGAPDQDEAITIQDDASLVEPPQKKQKKAEPTKHEEKQPEEEQEAVQILSVSGTGKKAVTIKYMNKTDHLLVPILITGIEKIDPGNAYRSVVTLLTRISIDFGEFKNQLRQTGEICCFAPRRCKVSGA